MTEKKQPKEGKPLPQCKAILLCERTMIDTATNKLVLMGITHTCFLAEFPGHTEKMKLFLQLVNGIGEYTITVEIYDLEEDNIILRSKGYRLSFPNRFDFLQPIFRIPALPIEHPGRYDVIVLGSGKEINRQQLRIKPFESKGESK